MLDIRITKKLWHFDLELNVKINNQILVLWGRPAPAKLLFYTAWPDC